jgi:hypothetical protein
MNKEEILKKLNEMPSIKLINNGLDYYFNPWNIPYTKDEDIYITLIVPKCLNSRYDFIISRPYLFPEFQQLIDKLFAIREILYLLYLTYEVRLENEEIGETYIDYIKGFHPTHPNHELFRRYRALSQCLIHKKFTRFSDISEQKIKALIAQGKIEDVKEIAGLKRNNDIASLMMFNQLGRDSDDFKYHYSSDSGDMYKDIKEFLPPFGGIKKKRMTKRKRITNNKKMNKKRIKSTKRK